MSNATEAEQTQEISQEERERRAEAVLEMVKLEEEREALQQKIVDKMGAGDFKKEDGSFDHDAFKDASRALFPINQKVDKLRRIAEGGTTARPSVNYAARQEFAARVQTAIEKLEEEFGDEFRKLLGGSDRKLALSIKDGKVRLTNFRLEKPKPKPEGEAAETAETAETGSEGDEPAGEEGGEAAQATGGEDSEE